MEKMGTYLKLTNNCKVGNRVYFVNLTFNGLLYLDVNDYSVHFVHKFSFERADARALSSNGNILFDNSIYFFPNNTNSIMKYDLLEQKEGMIEIPGQSEKDFRYAGVVWQEDIGYIFPIELKKGIYKFYLHEQKVYKDEELSSLFEKGFLCAGVFLIQDKNLLVAQYGGNQLVEVDLQAKKIRNRRYLNKDLQICSLYYDNNNYWIIQTKSVDIYKWNQRTNALQVYKNETAVWVDNKNEEMPPYSNLIFLDDEILVLNYGLKNIFRIHNGKGTIGNKMEFPEGFQLVNIEFAGWPVCDSYTVLEDRVLLYPSRGNMMLIYDRKTHELSGKEMIVFWKESPYFQEILKEIFFKRKWCVERDDVTTLKYFVEFNTLHEDKMAAMSKACVGESVYQYLKGENP